MSKRKHAIEAYFQSGVRLHSAGRLQEAESVYRQVLAASPRHADCLHMLGVIASQCGQPQAAVACIDQAIAIKPSTAMFHVNRASALLALRQLDAALEACRQALRFKPNLAEAQQMMGHVLSDLGRPEEATPPIASALQAETGPARRPQRPGAGAARGEPAGRGGRGAEPRRAIRRRTIRSSAATSPAS